MSGWTDEQLEQMRVLWLVEGKSAGEVARIMGNGCTRNTVVGQAHRRGWHRTGVPAGRPKPVYVPRPQRPKPAPVLEVVALDPIGPMNDFPETRGACRFIHGDPLHGNWQCCGHPVQKDRSWCAHHMPKVYDKVRTVEANRRYLERRGTGWHQKVHAPRHGQAGDDAA